MKKIMLGAVSLFASGLLLASTGSARAGAFEGQLKIDTMRQLEQAAVSPEHRYLASNDHNNEVILLATLEQITKMATEQAKTNALLSEQLQQSKHTNVLLEYMATGVHRHDLG